MASYFSVTIVVLATVFGSSMAGIVPAAPLVAAAPAAIAAAPVFGYAKAVPQNIPPHSSRIDINTRALAAPYVAVAPYITAAAGAPYIAAPAAAPYIAAPAAAPYIAAPTARLAYSPYAAPAGLVEAAYAGSFGAPLAHAAVAAHGPAILG